MNIDQITIDNDAELEIEKLAMNKEKPSLVFDKFHHYHTAMFMQSRIDQGLSTITKKVSIGINIYKFIDAIKQDFLISHSNERYIGKIAVSNDGNIFILMEEDNNTTNLEISGSSDSVEHYVQEFESKFPTGQTFIDWVYDPQYLESIRMPLDVDNMPIDDMYPFLENESLQAYFDRFMDSKASILILTGLPGTGKTTMIRGLLDHTKQSATLAYSEKIISKDSFFVEWFRSENSIMVLEDADQLIIPRKDGNELMSRFLNVGDGLMSMKNKKIIFTTNLPSIASSDSALTRPGRCFDIIEFGKLNRQQAKKVCDAKGLALPNGDAFTLAELFEQDRKSVKIQNKRGFGFI